MDKKQYHELKKTYQDLTSEYIEEKHRIKDDSKAQLVELKDNYKLNKKIARNPMKAERLRLKLESNKQHRLLNEPPKRLILEEIGNSITPGVGALLGVAALVLMLLKVNKPNEILAVIVYGACLIFLMLFSCLYHAFRSGAKVKRVLRRFDYSSIYLLIGGTFAPLFLIYWTSTLGTVLFIVQWVLIITGITMVCVFGPGRLKWLHFPLYFLIGWSGIMFIPGFIKNDLPLFFSILGGGIVYSLGMIPFALLRKKPTAHFIWHFFVLAGAIVQWFGVYLYIL